MQRFIYFFFIGTGMLASSCGKKNSDPSSSLVISSFTPVSAAKDEIVTITGTGFSAHLSGHILLWLLKQPSAHGPLCGLLV